MAHAPHPTDPPHAPETPQTRWWVAVVQGRSMLPTLAEGNRLLVRSGDTRARVGRLAVVRLPGGRPVAVKRLVGRGSSGWWVGRDNPAEGVDSWTAGIGPIPDDQLLGVVVARLWPRPRRL